MGSEFLLTNTSSNTHQNTDSGFSLGSGFVGNALLYFVFVKEHKVFQVFYNEQVWFQLSGEESN